MTTETYLYNKKSTLRTMLISAGFIAYFTYYLVVRTIVVSDPGLWLAIVLDIGVIAYVLYLYTVRVKPAVRRETVLELTPVDLVFKPKNIIIPWNTISNIDTKAANRSGTQQYLEITLKDTAEMKQVRIDLDWVAGDPTDIYTAVVNYLYETRKAAEKYSQG
jgi:hypothetical protein